jgi:hypothetical protein
VAVGRQVLQGLKRHSGPDHNADNHQGPSGVGHCECQTEHRIGPKPFIEGVASELWTQAQGRQSHEGYEYQGAPRRDEESFLEHHLLDIGKPQNL